MTKKGIVVFAFGRPGSILSNKILSHIASKKARDSGMAVYTQSDIQIEDRIEIEFIKERRKPPTTLQIVKGAIEWAIRNSITELLVIAAKPHLRRCLRDLSYIVKAKGVIIQLNPCKEIEEYPKEIWFCSDSEQKYTRSKTIWEKREDLLKNVLPFFIYRIMAG